METIPTLYKKIFKVYGVDILVETSVHSNSGELNKSEKTVKRTVDFTVCGNVILLSDAGSRQFLKINN